MVEGGTNTHTHTRTQIHSNSVYFRISLKRGQTFSAIIQGGANTQIQEEGGGEGNPILKIGESQLLGRRGGGGGKAPPGPPEINPAHIQVHTTQYSGTCPSWSPLGEKNQWL